MFLGSPPVRITPLLLIITVTIRLITFSTGIFSTVLKSVWHIVAVYSLSGRQEELEVYVHGMRMLGHAWVTISAHISAQEE